MALLEPRRSKVKRWRRWSRAHSRPASGSFFWCRAVAQSAYLIFDGVSLGAGAIDKKYDIVGMAWQRAGKLITGSEADGATVRMLIPIAATPALPGNVAVPKSLSVSVMRIPAADVATLEAALGLQLGVEWTTSGTLALKGSLGTVTVLQMSARPGSPGWPDHQATIARSKGHGEAGVPWEEIHDPRKRGYRASRTSPMPRDSTVGQMCGSKKERPAMS